MAELGGSQISALLESVPGIASVLRSPVADALVNMIRAGAGVGEFTQDDAEELIQYAVRRGLIGADEGDEVLREVMATGRGRRRGTAKTRSKTTPKAAKKSAKKGTAKKPAKKTAKKTAKKSAKRSAKKTAKKKGKKRAASTARTTARKRR